MEEKPMKEFNTTEYRQKSAEALRLEIRELTNKNTSRSLRGAIGLYYKNKDGDFELWMPDTDANQMLMVWEWLIGQVDSLSIEHVYRKWDIVMYEHEIICTDKDIKLATGKAFMEYKKSA